MTEEDIKNLSKKELQDITFKVQKLLSDKQKKDTNTELEGSD